MYEEIYAPLPDKDKYLRRLGLDSGSIKPDLESLERIMRAHLARIPFENIDAFDEGKTPSLGVPQLFDKMINHRRGGWCFELNGLMGALLEALGYSVYNVGVRVTIGGNELALVLHRGLIVEIDGKKYYCDVGFGTLAFLQPIPLSGETTAAGYRIHCRDGVCRVYDCRGEEDEELLRFEDRPYSPQDFVTANFFTSQNTETPFRKRRSISMQDGSLRRQLVDSTMKEYINDQLMRTVTAEDNTRLKALLEDCFDLEYDFE